MSEATPSANPSAGISAARAALSVVQLGSHTSFLRRAVEALRAVAPSSGAAVCFGTDESRAYSDSTRWAHGSFRSLEGAAGVPLSRAFGFDVSSVVRGARSVFDAEQLYPADVRRTLPYFRENAADAHHSLVLFLHEGGVLFGVAALHRAASEPAFSDDELNQLELLVRYLAATARWQLAYDELSREASALRALAHVRGTLAVVDRDHKRVVWAANRQAGLDWSRDVAPNEEALVSAADSMLAATQRSDALPTPPRCALGVVTKVAALNDDPVFFGGRCIAVHLEPVDERREAAMDQLSRREREIARLLVAGYSGVNVAAISGLSENTVRTYVRRLYAKLKVNNRAELVRTLMTPQASQEQPLPTQASHTPPDSSLAYGDDTLD